MHGDSSRFHPHCSALLGKAWPQIVQRIDKLRTPAPSWTIELRNAIFAHARAILRDLVRARTGALGATATSAEVYRCVYCDREVGRGHAVPWPAPACEIFPGDPPQFHRECAAVIEQHWNAVASTVPGLALSAKGKGVMSPTLRADALAAVHRSHAAALADASKAAFARNPSCA